MKDIILALVTRGLFAAHGLVGIWRAQSEWNDVYYWLLLVPVGALIVEALFTVGVRGGEEYKWVSPCVFLYLCSIVPAIWFLELKNFETRLERHYCNDRFWGETVKPGCRAEFNDYPYVDLEEVLNNDTRLQAACESELKHKQEQKNYTSFMTTPMMTTVQDNSDLTTIVGSSDQNNDVLNSIEGAAGFIDDIFQKVDIFNETTWVLVLHQLLLFILIIGRWLLPTGEGISRDELSQLLLVFIGVGADILEFVTETIKERSVRCDKILIICIMGFWSWSTLQFTLVLTAAKSRRTRAAGIYGDGDEETGSRSTTPANGTDGPAEKQGACSTFWSNVEVWGILSTLMLQDGPFLAMRLYIMIGRKVIHQMIVFFTFKNFLVVVLQIYRLVIVATSKPEVEEEVNVPRQKMEAVRAVAIAKAKFAKGLTKRVESPSKKGKRSPKIAPIKTIDLPKA